MRCAKSAIAERLACALAGAALASCGAPPVTQPMDFSHKLHVDAKVECTTCHEKAGDAPAATLPPLRVCAKCHKELQGKDAKREQPIIDAVLAKKEVAWVQVNREPGHVYFSHRPHVGFAELECETCHGDMKSLDHPLAQPNVEQLTMRACINCHREKGAALDCLTCHK